MKQVSKSRTLKSTYEFLEQKKRTYDFLEVLGFYFFLKEKL
jgi:hypothetical protein